MKFTHNVSMCTPYVINRCVQLKSATTDVPFIAPRLPRDPREAQTEKVLTSVLYLELRLSICTHCQVISTEGNKNHSR